MIPYIPVLYFNNLQILTVHAHVLYIIGTSTESGKATEKMFYMQSLKLAWH